MVVRVVAGRCAIPSPGLAGHGRPPGPSLLHLTRLLCAADFFVIDDFTLFETDLFTLFETDLILSESGIRPIQGVGLEIRPFPLSVRDCKT